MGAHDQDVRGTTLEEEEGKAKCGSAWMLVETIHVHKRTISPGLIGIRLETQKHASLYADKQASRHAHLMTRAQHLLPLE